MTDSPPLPRLAPRKADSHKGDFGRALLIGGSRGMTGAIALAGKAALRGGAGLVTLAVADACLDVIASHEPSYMTIPLACDKQGRIAPAAFDAVMEAAANATCVACGPGLARSAGLTELVGRLYGAFSQPAVFDADALNALSEQPDALASPAGARILTPHPGEFRRLIGYAQLEIADMPAAAIQFAADQQAVVVLKGHRTLVTDGERSAYNTTGNPGMSTGGTGDVLTGVITALVCQGLAPFDAAHLGVYLHGLAGDLAGEKLGQVAMIASDLVDHLPAALQQYGAQ